MMPNSRGHSSSAVGNLIWTSLPADPNWWSCLNGINMFISDDFSPRFSPNKCDHQNLQI
jgi:hypothetical protein